jgi:hypothetical protein
VTKFVVTWLIFVVVLDAFLFMGQLAVNEINPAGAPQFFDLGKSITASQDAGNYTLSDDVLGKLPEGEGAVSPVTGNIFTDVFTSMTSWFKSVPGVGYITAYVNAFPSFLNSLGLPPLFVFIIGSMWHTINIFAIILLIWGRD